MPTPTDTTIAPEPVAQVTDGSDSVRAAARFGPVDASWDGWLLELSCGQEPDDRVAIGPGSLLDVIEAFERHDGLLCSPIEFYEAPDGTTTLSWSDYDIEENPIGGRVDVPTEHVGALLEWMKGLESPPLPARLRALAAENLRQREETRELLKGGLPESMPHDGRDYHLFARDEVGVGLYSIIHGHEDDPALWLMRHADGSLTLSSRPQAPDRHGRPRRHLPPKAPRGSRWLWLRERPGQS